MLLFDKIRSAFKNKDPQEATSINFAATPFLSFSRKQVGAEYRILQNTEYSSVRINPLIFDILIFQKKKQIVKMTLGCPMFFVHL